MHIRLLPVIPAAALALAACNLEGTTATLNTVPLNFCSNVSWVAYQSGTSPWKYLASSDGTYQVQTEARLGVAWITEGSTNFPTMHVAFMGIEEASVYFFCDDSSNTHTVTGFVSGMAPTDSVTVSLGPAHASVPAGDTAFSVGYVPPGALDVLATRVLQPTGDTRTIAGAIIKRSQSFGSADTVRFDFNSLEAFVPNGNSVTVTNPTGNVISSTSEFFTPTGASMVLGIRDGTTTSAPFFSIPSGLLLPGDIHRARFTVQSATPNVTLVSDVYYRTGADNTFQLGPDPTVPVFSSVAGPYVRMKADVASQAIYGNRVHYVLTQPPGAAHGETVIFDLTRSWWGSTPSTWSLVLPDFSALQGWQSAWAPQPGSYTWTETVTGTALAAGAVHDGDLFRTATQTGTTSFTAALTSSEYSAAQRH